MSPGDKRSRPDVANIGAADDRAGNLKSTSSMAQLSDTDSQVGVRRRWAYNLIRRSPSPPPSYGTREWSALPDGSPAKIAAVVIAAENWARDGDDLEDNLRREIELARAAHKRLEDEEYVARWRGHQEHWSKSGLLELPPPHRRNQPVPPEPVRPLRERMRLIRGEAS